MPASPRIAALLSILLPVLAAAAIFAAMAIAGAGRLARPDARSPVPMRLGEYRGRPAREFVERGTIDRWGTPPEPSPGAIDDPDDR